MEWCHFFFPSAWHASDTLNLHTDASGSLGFGVSLVKSGFRESGVHTKNSVSPVISIAWQELFAIVAACQIWGELLADQRIKFHCDNEAVVGIINTKRSQIPG